MKKLIMLGLLAINFHISQVLADAAAELQIRLNKINSFYASFAQKVTSADGDLIQQGKGQLWIKRPNLFNWHMASPDESWLVSDGTNLWFYNPFIEQVTVTLLSEATTNTPFTLIISNDLRYWKRYRVSQRGDNFLLTEIHNEGKIKYFSITVQLNGTIQQLTTVEQDGQISTYQLNNQQNNHIDDDKFKFVLPERVILDDQRPKR